MVAKKAPARAAAARKPPRKRAAPPRFGERGERLWAAYHELVDGELGTLLLEEACRIADRLEQLDRLLQGDETLWAFVSRGRGRGRIEVHVDAALVEARQQAVALRQVVSSLPLKGGGDDSGSSADSWVDELV